VDSRTRRKIEETDLGLKQMAKKGMISAAEALLFIREEEEQNLFEAHRRGTQPVAFPEKLKDWLRRYQARSD